MESRAEDKQQSYNKIEGESTYQPWTTYPSLDFASASNTLLPCVSPTCYIFGHWLDLILNYTESETGFNETLTVQSCSELGRETACPCGSFGCGFMGSWDLSPGTCVRSADPVCHFRSHSSVATCSPRAHDILAAWVSHHFRHGTFGRDSEGVSREKFLRISSPQHGIFIFWT